MLLEPSSSSPIGQDGQCASPNAGKHDLLLSRVRTAFPHLTIRRSRLEERGGEHDLLIIDERHAFRFPRSGTHDLALEIAVLGALRTRSHLSVPAYNFADPAGEFAGYRYIEGFELSPALFAALSMADQDAVLAAAAQFLSELHRLSPVAVGWPGDWPIAPSAVDHSDHGLARLSRLERRLPSRFTERFREFWHSYRQDCAPELKIIHGDLVSEHLIFDPAPGRLTGIIDFGDVALGDPAQDFLAFWAYGEVAARQAVQYYSLHRADVSLLARSRHHFIRYRLHRLAEDLAESSDVDVVERAAEIEGLLEPTDYTHHSFRRE